MNPFDRHQGKGSMRASSIPLSPKINRETTAQAITEAAFNEWIKRAAPGETLEYHRGHLGADRFSAPPHMTDRRRQELCRVADRAMMLADEGSLLLVQRRIGPERTAYLAIKATSPCFPKTL